MTSLKRHKIFYKDPEIRGMIEDMNLLNGRDNFLTAPGWLKRSWGKEKFELDNLVYKKDRRYVKVGNEETYLTYIENLLLPYCIPKRFYRMHQRAIYKKYRKINAELIKNNS